jgi:hypothetical protein
MKVPSFRRNPSEVHSYFEHLCGEFYALPSQHEPDNSYVGHINQIIKKGKTKEVDWDDMFQFELLLLKLMPEAKLRRKAWLLRKRWKNVVSPEASQLYDMSLKKDHHQDREDLLADLEVLLQDLFWHYQMSTAWERQSGKFANNGWLFLLIMLIVLTAVVPFLLSKLVSKLSWPLDWSVILTASAVAFSGALGGFLSMLRRLKKVSDEMHRSSQLIAIESSRIAIILQAMLTGSAFALVLWLMFAGGFLAGNLFPKEVKGGAASLLDPEMAKLLVWSFIAGFAERFVPDLLDKFAKGEPTEKEHTSDRPCVPGEDILS